MRRLIPLALAVLGTRASAQSIWDSGARLAPQFFQFQIQSPVNQTISEFVMPVYAVMPLSPGLTMDVGTAYASAQVRSTGGAAAGTSTINGFTDTQIRANYTLGTDFVVFTAGLNLPTGRETVQPNELVAATRIGSDFLALPINTMGTGLGGTGGIAIARPLGEWNLGIGASARMSAAYDPFVDATGARLHYQPGNEYRARVGVDHPFGTGSFALGLTYDTFGNDVAGGFTYNTGDRYIAQVSLTNSVSGVDVTVAGWNLYRASGTLNDGTPYPYENVANGILALGFHPAGMLVEPSIELRDWQQAGQFPGTLGTLGLRWSMSAGAFGIDPSVGYSVGRIASLAASGTGSSYADMTGFRAMLLIRMGGH